MEDVFLCLLYYLFLFSFCGAHDHLSTSAFFQIRISQHSIHNTAHLDYHSYILRTWQAQHSISD
jgi:hypothetical protein